MAQLLLATNFTPNSDRAVDRAKLIATLPGFEMQVLYVVPEDKSRPDKHVLREIDRATAKLRDEFDRPTENAKENPDLIVLHGDPKSEIVACAKRSKASLIVMGDTREFTLETLFRGTIADQVISETQSAVLIIHRRPQSQYKRVLVPFNDTHSCLAAFEKAFMLAPDTKFTVVHAETDRKSCLEDLQVKQRKFESKLRAALPGLMGPDQPVSGGLDVIIERGEPTEVILRKAEELEPDLTAFGRSNRSGLGALIMGSTAQVLVEHLDCDLLVANAVQPEPDSKSGKISSD